MHSLGKALANLAPLFFLCPSYDYEVSGWTSIPRVWSIKPCDPLECWLWKWIFCSFSGMEIMKNREAPFPSIFPVLQNRVSFLLKTRALSRAGLCLPLSIQFFAREKLVPRELVCGQSLGIWLLATLHWEPWDHSSRQSRSSTHIISGTQTAGGASIV